MSISRARVLRKNMTEAEKTLGRRLRSRQIAGYKFRRQHPIGRFVVDFACVERKLVIEVDGGQHAEQEAIDVERTAWLEEKGYKVLRFWNNEVLGETDGVLQVIFEEVGPPPQSSPCKGEEEQGSSPCEWED